MSAEENNMQHFYVREDQIADGHIYLEGDDYNHIKNVLRMKQKESFMAADGSGIEYYCILEAFEEGRVIARIAYKQESRQELPVSVTIYQGLPKGDKLELIIQKCVELGATEIVPVAMKRSIVKLDDKKAAAKQKRWQAIADAAAKQCGRAGLMQVKEVTGFKDCLEEAKKADICLFPYEMAGVDTPMKRTREIIASIRTGMKVAVFIGPEGGFDDSEVLKAREYGFEPITLGKRILRTETVGIYIMSVLGYILEQD